MRLLFFWGSWCPVCKQMETMLDMVELPVMVTRINVDRNPLMAMQHQVMGTPTFCLVDDTKEIRRVVGAVSSKQLKQFVRGGT